MPSDVVYRELQPGDLPELKAIHKQLFPLDYEDSFYNRAVHGLDRLYSRAAIHRGVHGTQANIPAGTRPQLIGFVTARLVYVYECDPVDRHHLGLTSRAHDNEALMYVLTLGVSDAWRKRGIASCMLDEVWQHAAHERCRGIFLHVISYNDAAMRLYTRHHYSCAGRLGNFYYIATGRQPDPSQQSYDALLYVHFLPSATRGQGYWQGQRTHAGGKALGGRHHKNGNSVCHYQQHSDGGCYSGSGGGGGGGAWGITPSWAASAASAILNTAAAPIRNVLGHLGACMPQELCSTRVCTFASGTQHAPWHWQGSQQGGPSQDKSEMAYAYGDYSGSGGYDASTSCNTNGLEAQGHIEHGHGDHWHVHAIIPDRRAGAGPGSRNGSVHSQAACLPPWGASPPHRCAHSSVVGTGTPEGPVTTLHPQSVSGQHADGVDVHIDGMQADCWGDGSTSSSYEQQISHGVRTPLGLSSGAGLLHRHSHGHGQGAQKSHDEMPRQDQHLHLQPHAAAHHQQQQQHPEHASTGTMHFDQTPAHEVGHRQSSSQGHGQGPGDHMSHIPSWQQGHGQGPGQPPGQIGSLLQRLMAGPQPSWTSPGVTHGSNSGQAQNVKHQRLAHIHHN